MPRDAAPPATQDPLLLGAALTLSADGATSGGTRETAPAGDTHRRAPSPSALTLPTSLLPAVQATLTATATASAGVAPTSSARSMAAPTVTLPPVPLPDLPLPLPSGTPLVPTESAPAPATSGAAQTAPETRQAAAPDVQAARQVPAGPQEAGAPQAPGAAAAPAENPQAAPEGAPSAAPAAPEAAEDAGAGTGAKGVDRLASVTNGSRQSSGTRVPEAATLPGSAAAGSTVRSTGTLSSAQSDMQTAVVWLGIGLVAVGGAAGLVYLRLRKP